jgi:pyruvate ferredoxin oxidoreductase beta subunit
MIGLKTVLKILGKRTVMTVPACCTSIVQGIYPFSNFRVNTFNVAFATAAAFSSGVEAGLSATGKEDATVLAWAGDGGTFDIGLQALSGAAERNENILYVCYDNESYMNTGIQSSGATPYGAWTTTTPTGKRGHKKDIGSIMMAHDIPYAASASPAFIRDFTEKVTVARETRGTRFIHLLAPCPPGWRSDAEMTVRLARLAVETGMWILYEYRDEEFRFTGPSRYIAEGKRDLKPLTEYLSLQGRFDGVTDEDIKALEGWIDRKWSQYQKLADKR